MNRSGETSPSRRAPRTLLDGWVLGATILAALISAPVLLLLLRILGPPSEGWHHISSTVLPRYVLNSVGLITSVGSIVFVVGVATAWTTTTFEFPLRRQFEWMLTLPLAMPPFVAAISYAGLLDSTGPLQTLLRKTLDLSPPAQWFEIPPFRGVVFIFSIVLYPYVYLITRSSFSLRSNKLLEASRTLGRSRLATFFGVELPLARPAFVGGVAIVLMEVLNDYGTVQYYGVDTFSTGIFRAWFALDDVESAIRLAVCLLSITFVLLGLERWQRGPRSYSDVSGRHEPIRRRPLKGLQAGIAFTVCALPVLFGFLIPVGQLGWWSTQTASEILDSQFVKLCGNSFLLAGGGALLCVIAGLFLVYSCRVRPFGWLRFSTRFASLGYSIPSAVVAIGILLSLRNTDRLLQRLLHLVTDTRVGLILSGTLAAVFAAYLVRFLAVALQPIESGLGRIHRDLDSAARSLGSNLSGTLIRIHLPLLRPALLTAVILVFVDVLKELPLVLILRPFDFHTLATRAYELASDSRVAESACPSILIIALGFLPLILIHRLYRRGLL